MSKEQLSSIDQSPKEEFTPEQEKTKAEILSALEFYDELREYGIVIEDFPPEAYRIFEIARRIMAEKKLPGGVVPREIPDTVKKEVEVEIEKEIQKKRYVEEEKSVTTPSDQVNVRTIKSVPELIKALPAELMREDAIMIKRLLGRETLVYDWEESTRREEEYASTIKDKKLEEKEEEVEKGAKQKAYVLVDFSGSMSGPRLEYARAIAIAFFLNCLRQNGEVFFRPFTGGAGELSKARKRKEFQKLLRDIAECNYDGGTDIQNALEVAVKDIKESGEFEKADILLITDGQAELDDNPLGEINLHSLLIDMDEVDVIFRMKKLEEWSKTLTCISDNEIQDLVQREGPNRLLEGMSRHLPDIYRRFKQDVREIDMNLDDLNNLLQRLKNIQALARETDQEIDLSAELALIQSKMEKILKSSKLDIDSLLSSGEKMTEIIEANPDLDFSKMMTLIGEKIPDAIQSGQFSFDELSKIFYRLNSLSYELEGKIDRSIGINLIIDKLSQLWKDQRGKLTDQAIVVKTDEDNVRIHENIENIGRLIYDLEHQNIELLRPEVLREITDDMDEIHDAADDNGEPREMLRKKRSKEKALEQREAKRREKEARRLAKEKKRKEKQAQRDLEKIKKTMRRIK